MVVLISIDGLRPDGVKEASTPHLNQLIQEGSSTLAARSVMPSITLPCHSSMFRGVPPEVHGVVSNEYHRPKREIPSLFDLCHQNRKKSGMFYNWGQLRDLAAPESVDVSYLVNDLRSNQGDHRLVDSALAHSRTDGFDFLFLYLGRLDQIGHDWGWMSDEYLQGVTEADRQVGRLIDGLLETKQPLNVLVMSDHGGHDHSHGTDSQEDMTVPFILWGYEITSHHTIQQPVSIIDTAPTLARLINIPVAVEWQGKVVREAIRGGSLTADEGHHPVFSLEDE
ncbi:MAG: ectonucleotide pyrophosphatase/phosphodiesterase [Fimbriimonadaceae bacterium]|jgi:predicted AlkP superfamily pyrophosphatase or phosphodiesterase|nr:ectonucleotide pyrophosphatase/phosphodiesterase [Fimbriimonadaceae bacterium]